MGLWPKGQHCGVRVQEVPLGVEIFVYRVWWGQVSRLKKIFTSGEIFFSTPRFSSTLSKKNYHLKLLANIDGIAVQIKPR